MVESVQPLRLAGKFPARVKGLLRSKPADGVLMLMPCNDVHTVGMNDLLDIAFVGADGRVLESYRAVAPSRRIRCCGAVAVLERFSTVETPWFSAGDCVGVARKEGDRA